MIEVSIQNFRCSTNYQSLFIGKNIMIKLILNDYTLEPVISRNAIGDIRGREVLDEKVLISAHIDSWDVGSGAMDDGRKYSSHNRSRS